MRGEVVTPGVAIWFIVLGALTLAGVLVYRKLG